MSTTYRTFQQARKNLEARFRTYAVKVHTKKWQGQVIEHRPEMVSYELLNETFTVPLFGIESLQHWRDDIKPNLPWADAHHLERVSGAPLNPGVEWRNWPWASSADKHRTEGEMFNHTYAERLWPRYAGKLGPLETMSSLPKIDSLKTTPYPSAHRGIRGEYGDLRTLVDMLSFEPDTRQAYIPLYFPEDTGLEGRKPCTLGYQVIVRNNEAHLYYPLRSQDFVRHWADDIYLAIRLLLWIIDECRKNNPADWSDIKPGSFTMHATSLHVFANDAISMGIRR
jgi:hypothetical protein